MGSEKSIVKKGARKVPAAYSWGKRRYELVASGLKKRVAVRLQKNLEKNGFMARIKEFYGMYAVYKAIKREIQV